MAERTTDLRVASHRRLVTRAIVGALQDVFNDTYDRDRQLQKLHVGPTYPLSEIGYPAVVVEYENTRVSNAGVGHEEWFNDANDVLRKWNHNRFEGNINFDILALTTIDRDVVADALIELLRFGRLDDGMNTFFTDIYGDPNDPDQNLIFSQLMLNVDDISGSGNSESIAPWNPEDIHVYETSYTLEIHGGYYNVIPQAEWQYVSSISADTYLEGSEVVEIPFHDPDLIWTNPFQYFDAAEVKGRAQISGAESVVSGGTEYFDAATATGVAVPSATETETGRNFVDQATVKGTAAPSGVETSP